MNPRITLCVCTYNRYDVLPKAIESAKNQALDRALYRIIVVDNSPDHEQAKIFGSRYHEPPFLDYRIETTPGLSNARNVGSRDCGTEFIAFMDDDAIASPQWLEKLVQAFDQFDQDAVVAGGRVDPIWEMPRPVWLHDWNLGFVSVVNWGGGTRVAAPNEWLAGTNIAFRTKPLLDFGGFDAKLGRIGNGSTLLSNEEISMLNFFREQGLKAIYVPEASVQHLVERKRLTQTWFRKRVAWQAVSDFTMDPVAATKRVVDEWERVLDYFFQIPPSKRTVLGFYLDIDNPKLFQQQLKALEVFTLAVLCGFEGLGAIAHD